LQAVAHGEETRKSEKIRQMSFTGEHGRAGRRRAVIAGARDAAQIGFTLI
jgi:hypothetical protein